MSLPAEILERESALKSTLPAHHAGRRYYVSGGNFHPYPGQELVYTPFGWLRATEEEKRQGFVCLPVENGAPYRAIIKPHLGLLDG